MHGDPDTGRPPQDAQIRTQTQGGCRGTHRDLDTGRPPWAAQKPGHGHGEAAAGRAETWTRTQGGRCTENQTRGGRRETHGDPDPDTGRLLWDAWRPGHGEATAGCLENQTQVTSGRLETWTQGGHHRMPGNLDTDARKPLKDA